MILYSTVYMLLCGHFGSDVFPSACLSVISLQYAFSYLLLNGSFNLVLDKHQQHNINLVQFEWLSKLFTLVVCKRSN